MQSKAIISYSLSVPSDRARAAFKHSLKGAGWLDQEKYYNAEPRTLPETTLIIPYADPTMIKRDLDRALSEARSISAEAKLQYIVSGYEMILFEAPPEVPISELFKDLVRR